MGKYGRVSVIRATTHHIGLFRLDKRILEGIDVLVVPLWVAKVGHKGDGYRDVDCKLHGTSQSA
jgi:hypothetical protein